MRRHGEVKPRQHLALVDDDPAVLASLEAGLGRHFNIVAKCTCGEEVLKEFSDLPKVQRPQLLLLDIKMPGMNGIECCRELRRLFRELVLAMHTAKSVRERFEDARLIGADAFIVKGVALKNVEGTLQHLERREGLCVCVAGGEQPAKRPANAPQTFTTREIEVLDFVSRGHLYKQAAGHFACSESNIKKTVARDPASGSPLKGSRHPPLAATRLTCPKGRLPVSE